MTEAHGADPADAGRRAELGSLARQGSAGLLGAGASAVLSLLLVVVVTRSVSPEEAGVFVSLTSLFLIVEAACRLGTPTGLVWFVARYRALGDLRRARAGLTAALVPVVVVSGCAAGALAALAPWLAGLLVDGDPGSFAAQLRMLAAFVPVAALHGALVAGTQGYRSMRTTLLVEKVGRPLAQVVLVLVVVAVGAGDLLAVAWAGPYAGAAVLSGLALVALVRRTGRTPGTPPAPQRRPPLGVSSELWRFTAPRMLAGTAQVALQRLDIILVGALRGPAEAAVYAAATRFLVVGQLGAQGIGLAVQPRLAALLARRDLPAAAVVYRTATGWLMVAMWPLYLLSAVLAPLVLTVFGPAYGAGAPAMVLLAAVMLVATACGMVDMVLTMAGRTVWNLGDVLFALAVNVTLDLLLIPPYGLVGAAVAWAAAILAKNLLALAQVGITLRLHPFGRSTVVAGGLAAACFGLLPGAVRLAGGTGWVPSLMAVAAGVLLYGAGLWRWRSLLRLDELRKARLAGGAARRVVSEEVGTSR